MKLLYALCGLIITLLCSQSIYAQRNKNVPIAPIFAYSTAKKPVRDPTILLPTGSPQKELYELIGQAFHKNAAPVDDSVTSKPWIFNNTCNWVHDGRQAAQGFFIYVGEVF